MDLVAELLHLEQHGVGVVLICLESFVGFGVKDFGAVLIFSFRLNKVRLTYLSSRIVFKASSERHLSARRE